MKIKDVIEQTGLTDKAIRLYISNGLVAPSIEENYSGRKSIDFSEENVERLKNVALLRKAGFSIADIKGFLSDENSVNGIVNRFIEQKEKDIQRDTEIVNILKNISGEKLTFERLSDVLSETMAENEIPEEDMQVSKKERIFKKVFKFLGIFNLSFSVICILAYIILLKIEHRYFSFEGESWLTYPFAYGGFIIVSVLSGWLIRICSEKRMLKNNTAKLWLSFMLSFSVLLISVPWSFLCTVTLVYGTTVSKTEKVDNYLALDNYLYIDGKSYIEKLFPGMVPYNAVDVKYYYRYKHGFLQYEFDIFAEWKLPVRKFKKEVESNLYYYDKVPVRLDEKDGTPIYEIQQKKRETITKGDWKLIYFAESDAERKFVKDESGYVISVFAYNEITDTVRYFVSSSDYGEKKPYYISLEW